MTLTVRPTLIMTEEGAGVEHVARFTLIMNDECAGIELVARLTLIMNEEGAGVEVVAVHNDLQPVAVDEHLLLVPLQSRLPT